MHVFVFQLDGDDRTAFREELPPDLPGDLGIQLSGQRQIAFVVGPDLNGLCEHPVRNAAVANLAVAEGPDAHDEGKTNLLAQIDEMPQIPVTAPVEDALLFFMVIPEHVRRHDVNAARLHLQQLFFPVKIGKSGIVEFAHYGDPRLSILGHVIAGESVRFAAGIRPAQRAKPAGTDRFVPVAEMHRQHGLRPVRHL